MDLTIYRATDCVPVNPYHFDAGQGPGIDTLSTIIDLAKAAGCRLDPGRAGGPVYLRKLPRSNEDLIALLELAQVKEKL